MDTQQQPVQAECGGGGRRLQRLRGDCNSVAIAEPVAEPIAQPKAPNACDWDGGTSIWCAGGSYSINKLWRFPTSLDSRDDNLPDIPNTPKNIGRYHHCLTAYNGSVWVRMRTGLSFSTSSRQSCSCLTSSPA